MDPPIKCRPIEYIDVDELGNFICKLVVDYDPAYRVLWQQIAWCTTVLQLLMAVWTSHDIYRQWLAYKQGVMKRFLSSPILYTQIVSMISSVLMAIAYIDPWGMLDLFDGTSDTYLGIYAAPYGLIGAAVLMFAIYIINNAIWRQLEDEMAPSTAPTIGAVVVIVLMVLYAGVGFPIFGWVLAAAFKEDPNTKLGPIGNILAYVMYGLILFVSVLIPIGYQLVISKRAVHGEGVDLSRGRINRWCVWNVIATAVFLGVSLHRQYNAKDLSLLGGTFILLGTNRFLELFLQFNINSFQDSVYSEPWMLGCYIDLILCRKTRLKERGANRRTTERTSYKMTNSRSRSAVTSSGGEDITATDSNV